MRNVFLLYMPPSNLEAMVHYEDTIRRRVPFQRLAPFLSKDLGNRLKRVFADRPIAVWGSRDSKPNRSKFERMAEGDDLLIVVGDTIKLMGKIAAKTVGPDLSGELWKNLRGETNSGWDLIYFIANPVEIDVPFEAFCGLFGYESNYRLYGFTSVAPERLEAFYAHYDDLYSVLMRIRSGETVAVKSDAAEANPSELVELTPEDVSQVLQIDISEHVRMQWTLANLGIKAGQKVWVPRGDQTKLRSVYAFNEFEAEFAAGVDLPHSYLENIDVVWKEEFRIDAAFEVENSTSIYSGLLRFADLTVVAPNSIYPMFIVAPAEKRNRVRDQLLRPSFRRLELRNKVRFLPYEAIDEIDRFFPTASSGFSVDVIQGRAEKLD